MADAAAKEPVATGARERPKREVKAVDTFKIEVADAEGGGRTTYWIARDGRKTIKSSAVMPQFNGAVMTIERVE